MDKPAGRPPATRPAVPRVLPALAHVGLGGGSVGEVATAVAPFVVDAVDSGARVAAVVDGAARDHLADLLGARFDRVDVVPTTETRAVRIAIVEGAQAPLPPSILHALADTRTGSPGVGVAEDRINIMLAGRPLTVFCAAPHDVATTRADTVDDRHPFLLDDGSFAANPAFLPPARLCLLPASSWAGEHVRQLHFHGSRDLVAVRSTVREVCTERGLGTGERDVAVLAAHEAASAVVETARDRRARGQLDVWSRPPVLVLDISVVAPDARPRWDERVRLLTATAVGSPVRFDAGRRVLRVVVGPPAPPAPPGGGR